MAVGAPSSCKVDEHNMIITHAASNCRPAIWRAMAPTVASAVVIACAFLPASNAELGPCGLTALSPLLSAEEFAELAADPDEVDAAKVESLKDHAQDEIMEMQTARSQAAVAAGVSEENVSTLTFPKPTLPLKVPEEPLVFDGVDAPAAFRGLSSSDIRKLLEDTSWPRRNIAGSWRLNVSVGSHLKAPAGKEAVSSALASGSFAVGEGGDPLFIDQPVRDAKLRRLLRASHPMFRAARRNPIALLARPKQGIRVHAVPEPRWIQQVHGRAVWRLVRPGSAYVEGLDVSACGAAMQDSQVITCEMRPGSMLYVPAKWAWGACGEAREGGRDDASAGGFSLAVGAGGWSLGWPDHFHLVAEGETKQLRERLEADSGLVHIGDPATGATALELAVTLGDLKAAKLLKEHGARHDDTGSFQMTFPLHHAATFGQLEVLEWLLDMQASTLPKTKEEKTALHLAAENGHVECVRALIRRGSRADLHAVGEKRFTAVHFAVKEQHLDVVRVLRDEGAELSAPDASGCEPPIMAARHGDLQMLEFLLGDEGLNPDAKCDKGLTTAHVAARGGRTDVLDLLKRRKANLRATDDDKRTPLHIAAIGGVISVIDWFAKAGVKKLSPKTPGVLHHAVHAKQYDAVRALLAHGASATARDPRSGTEPAELATREGFAILAEFGATRPSGFVHRTVARGQLEVLRDLVKHEPGVEEQLSQAHDGLHPVHWAAQGGHSEVLSWLCQQMGADCSLRSSDETHGRTPVHFVAWSTTDKGSERRDRVPAMRYLLRDQHSDVDAVDKNGITALELAGVGGSLPLVQFLVKDAGADIGSLWQAKREGALDKKVEKWATKFAPKGAYGKWLDRSLPPPGPPPTPGPPGDEDEAEAQERARKKGRRRKRKSSEDL